MVEAPDRVIRALTDDGSFRVLTARTTHLCREAVQRQRAEGSLARHFADLLTGTVLVRETMAPELRVQGIVRGAGGGTTLIGDSFPDGGTRGLISRKKAGPRFSLGNDAMLQFMRSLPNGSVHRGVVRVPEQGGVSGALMAYMQESEQIITVMAVSALFDDAGDVRSAGGYVVQLLPGAEHDLAMVITERLAHDFAVIDSFIDGAPFDPDTLLEEILYGVPFARVETRDARFHCPCSQTSVLASLATLSPAEIRELLEADEVLDIACDYCGASYQVSPQQLGGLISHS